MLNLENKNIIIIGGTTGMGLAASKAFVENGASLVVVGLGKEGCEAARKELGDATSIIDADATRSEAISKALEAFETKTKPIHGLFHVAGGSGRKFGDGPLHDLTLEGWNKTLESNLTSVMLSNQAMVNYFMKNGIGGSILNMGSALASSPSPKYFATHAYTAAKSAIIGFTKSVAAYYAQYNIRANVLTPSLFITPMSQRAASDEHIMTYVRSRQPLDGGRAGDPEDIIGAACYFMSDASAFVTGQVLSIDGGWALSDGQIK